MPKFVDVVSTDQEDVRIDRLVDRLRAIGDKQAAAVIEALVSDCWRWRNAKMECPALHQRSTKGGLRDA